MVNSAAALRTMPVILAMYFSALSHCPATIQSRRAGNNGWSADEYSGGPKTMCLN